MSYKNYYMSKIFLEILDTNRQNLFTQLAQFKSVGYLAGGTALALQMGHRRSVDFDIFVDTEIDNKLRLQIKSMLPVESYLINTPDQISVKTVQNISVTFLWYYFPRIADLIPTDSLPLASIDDITADKAMTIGRRAVWRDYVDIYFLLKNSLVSVDKMVNLASKKFGAEFIPTQFLQQLVYYKDMDVVPIEYMSEKPSVDEIQNFLKKSVQEYVPHL